VSNGVGIGHLESSLLQIIAVVELRTADEESTLGVDHDVHPLGRNEDITGHRPIDEVHLVLEAGAAAADHSHAKSPLRASLLGEE
jgi:hypothetical protein